jgi:tetratricopeptide (TPR) repeat protein
MSRRSEQGHPVAPPAVATDLPALDAGAVMDPYDVWSKWGSRYQFRAMMLLGVNVILFSGLACFAFWLRRGVPFAFLTPGYWEELAGTFNFSSGEVTLRALLLTPISIQDVPMQIPILGLLLAALISIPIVVSILYRFWSAVPFILIVAFLAVMPWLAITLVGSCILASVRPFRTTIPFVSALVGLVPASLYLVLASSGRPTEEVMGTLPPIESMKFIAPWALAVVAGAVVFAIVLTLARAVNYRPGAVTPLLAVMFYAPVALFEYQVGRDELYYRLLESRHGFYFADRPTYEDLARAVAEEYRNHPPPRPPREQIRQAVVRRWSSELIKDPAHHRTSLREYQDLADESLAKFLTLYPDSRYERNAWYLRAVAIDMRFDAMEFSRSRLKWVRYYSDHPARESQDMWRKLSDGDPLSKITVMAMLRRAQFEARDGEVERAKDRLDSLLRSASTLSDTERLMSAGTAPRGMFDRPPPEESLAISMEDVLFEAERLRDLLRDNIDSVNGDRPLAGSPFVSSGLPDGLLDLDPREVDYVDRLRALREAYPGSLLDDNIDLELAKAYDSSLGGRIELLQELLNRYGPSPEAQPADRGRYDAVPEALFRLALAYRDDRRPREARSAFERLLREHPGNLWSRQALHHTGVYLESAIAGGVP